MQDFLFHFLSPFLLSNFLMVRIFCSSVAPANQDNFSACTLWSLINIRVNFATDVTEDCF